MSTISQRLKTLQATLPPHVQLVAVSKFHPVETLQEAYDAGVRCFGESRVQELNVKYERLPKDIEWHFIGHLQTNKVKYIIPYISLIHSVDSIRILDEIERQAARQERVVDCLLEVHVAQEDTKYGFTPPMCLDVITPELVKSHPHVRLCGIMGMASNTDDDELIKEEFAQLKHLYDALREGVMKNASHFNRLSMGMSHDYLIAIEQGSNMVRVGTTIFGEREY